MIATESSLNRWQIRLDGGEAEEAQGRMVSHECCKVLGVSPAIGREFRRAA